MTPTSQDSKEIILTKFYRLNTEAVVRRSSLKMVFLEISQNSRENTCARDSFLLKALGQQLHSKRVSSTGVFQ